MADDDFEHPTCWDEKWTSSQMADYYPLPEKVQNVTRN